MEQYNMIIAGVIGSSVTLFLTAIIDYFKEKIRDKRERSKIYFERKIDASEKAMSWFQEAIDCWSMMQMAFDEMRLDNNPVTIGKLIKSTNNANKLYLESSSRLNPLYLYYSDMSAKEKKHNADDSMLYINDALCEIGKYNQQIEELFSDGKNDNEKQINDLKNKIIILIREISKLINNQIDSLVEMQERLQKEYKQLD